MASSVSYGKRCYLTALQDVSSSAKLHCQKEHEKYLLKWVFPSTDLCKY
jgi:hypothetical protein